MNNILKPAQTEPWAIFSFLKESAGLFVGKGIITINLKGYYSTFA